MKYCVYLLSVMIGCALVAVTVLDGQQQILKDKDRYSTVPTPALDPAPRPAIDTKRTYQELPVEVKDFIGSYTFATYPPDSIVFDDGLTLSLQDITADFPHRFSVWPSEKVQLVRTRAAVYIVFLTPVGKDHDDVSGPSVFR